MSQLTPQLTSLQVLDYGAARDGVSEQNLGRRIVVDADGFEANNDDGGYLDLDGSAERDNAPAF